MAISKMAPDEETNDEAHAFIRSLDLKELCNIASAQRQGVACVPGHHTIGGMSAVMFLL